jgi:NADH dehydrogenase
VRRKVLEAFGIAEREPDATARAALLNFVIIGGGPTGVELAGALAEIARHSLKDDFRAIDPSEARRSLPLPEGFRPRQTKVQVIDHVSGKSLGMRVMLVQ